MKYSKLKKYISGILAAFVLTTTLSFAPETLVRAEQFKSDVSSYNEDFLLNGPHRLFVLSEEEPSLEVKETAELIYQQFSFELNEFLMEESGETMSDLSFVWGEEEEIEPGDIVLILDPSSGISEEGFKLEVKDKVVITSGGTDGLLYGSNDFLKHLRYEKKRWEEDHGGTDVKADSNETEEFTIPGFKKIDSPDTKERTVMLDTGRKYFTKEWICNFIRQMSWMGYNTLELHFSEDGGFRADFWDEAFYEKEDQDGDGYTYDPVNDFSWLCGSHVQSWVKEPYRNDPDEGKYLTTEELVEICEVAKEYHIDLIPSFDSPAHMDYITWKFEQNFVENPDYTFEYDDTVYEAASTEGCINYTGKTGASSPQWPYYTTVDITEDTMARAFVFSLYNDIADFFKEYAGSEDFSIGGDEVNLNSSYGPKWEYAQFPDYVNELNRMLNDKGYTCRMFNDFIGSSAYNPCSDSDVKYEFDDNIEIMYWNSDFNPTSGSFDEPVWKASDFYLAYEEDRILYNCIQTNCYYVLRVAPSNSSFSNMDARNPENYNWTFYHSDEKTIFEEWKPDEIAESGLYREEVESVPESNLGGAYFLIWNDYAALNTEEEIWKGAADSTGTSSLEYSLLDRMYANIGKMWHWDLNESLSYEEYRDSLETNYFYPGYVSCTENPDLPDTVEISPMEKEEPGFFERLFAWIQSLFPENRN